MGPVIWTPSAVQELNSAADYIALDSRRYASALVQDVREAARSLSKFAHSGRVVPEVADTSVREIFVKSYRLIYEIRSDQVVILAFLHGAREFPPDLSE
ncbi:MAG: type II toxin-antitoxin system RelE/ParE family toxin [Acidobacteriota bacterium]